MSFLSSMFDPVGAAVTGGNNDNLFTSMFNPAQDVLGDNGFGVEPSWLNNWNDTSSNTAENWGSDVVNANEDELRNLGNHFSKNPGQVFYSGADPFSTKVWNAVTNQDNTPFLSQMGGETKQDFQNSANRGVNTEDHQYLSTLANMIASYQAGKWGAGALGSAGASAGGAAANSGAGAAAGNGAGFTGSNAGWEAAGEAGDVGAGGASGAEAANQAYDAGKYAGAAYGSQAYRPVSGAAQGAANALDNNQNPWKGAFQGGLKAGLGSNLDYAGTMGVEDPNYKNVINGGINGGVKAGMNDTSQTGYGALVGALGGLASDAGRGINNYLNQSSGSNSTPGQSGGTNWENLAAGLGNLYMARRNGAGIQGQINNLNSLYAPNSPYAQQMQQALDRQDAAGGRRSQYGTRAVQLQAALAEANSRNAPTLANLYAQQRQNRFGQLSGLFAMGRNSGAFNGMGNYLQGFGSGANAQPTGYSQQVPMTPISQLDSYNAASDVNNTIPDQLYGG
jgi:hypothetical protein